MDCPRDNVEMTELTEGEERILFRCGECGGLWLDAADLNRILLHAGLQTLEGMGGRANPDTDAGLCPVDEVGLLAIESHHKRDPLVYETCESCGGVWLESADFADEGTSARALKAGIVDFFREFSSHKASAGSR
ncbi:MAG: zf-TFIIB domain-containing protein [Myxococcales bacterium]